MQVADGRSRLPRLPRSDTSAVAVLVVVVGRLGRAMLPLAGLFLLFFWRIFGVRTRDGRASRVPSSITNEKREPMPVDATGLSSLRSRSLIPLIVCRGRDRGQCRAGSPAPKPQTPAPVSLLTRRSLCPRRRTRGRGVQRRRAFATCGVQHLCGQHYLARIGVLECVREQVDEQLREVCRRAK